MNNATTQGAETMTEITVGMQVIVTDEKEDGAVVSIREGVQMHKPPCGRFTIGVRTERWGFQWYKPSEIVVAT